MSSFECTRLVMTPKSISVSVCLVICVNNDPSEILVQSKACWVDNHRKAFEVVMHDQILACLSTCLIMSQYLLKTVIMAN